VSMSRRFLALGVACLLVVGAWFFVAFRPAQSRLSEARVEAEQAEQEVSRLQDRLTRLRALAANEDEVLERAVALARALPPDPGMPDFIRFVQEAANSAGVGFLSVNPGQPSGATSGMAAPSEDGEAAPAGGVQTIPVQITAEGAFVGLERFVLELERLARAVRITDFTLSGAGDGGGNLSLQMSLEVYMSPAASAAGAGQATSPDQDQ
jgi:Tfp pilus assembly protein PilO